MIAIRSLLFREKFHSRWLVLAADLSVVFLSVCLSFFLKGRFEFNQVNPYYAGLYCITTAAVFLSLGIHRRIIRHSNTRDMLRIFMAVLASNVLFMLLCKIWLDGYLNFSVRGLEPTLMINFFISSTMLTAERVIVKDLFKYAEGQPAAVQKENVLIFGAGKSSMLLKNAIETQKGLVARVQGFVDNAIDKRHKQLEQIPVYPVKAIEGLKQKLSIKKMFITADQLTADGKRRVIDRCISLGIKVVTVPPSDQWLNGQPSLNQFKDLKIEDLLEREPIKLHKEHIMEHVSGKRVLITGAAGSIGSEIVRQVLGYQPEYVVLCDQAETPLHDIQLEIHDSGQANKSRICVADIKNTNRLRWLFEQHKPQIVFHAAAYKHVPMMENNPIEAVLTNIWGTKNLADISLDYGAEKFIMISTDKAVKPTNVMGASKRIAEMYIQSLNEALLNGEPFNNRLKKGNLRHTKFITTRFGNVLGSNGSVIPRFKAQIQRGGPVTVTHPEITRYFMTIPESVQLVLEAAVMGKGGEIFLFDMGKPVKIADMAANMIKLAGYLPGEDIKIVYTGLRPGEKLYEELLNQEEQSIPTYNKDIKISKTIPNSYTEVNHMIKELLEITRFNSVDNMVLKMKAILPDFVSNNSQFEKLDKSLSKSVVL